MSYTSTYLESNEVTKKEVHCHLSLIIIYDGRTAARCVGWGFAGEVRVWEGQRRRVGEGEERGGRSSGGKRSGSGDAWKQQRREEE